MATAQYVVNKGKKEVVGQGEEFYYCKAVKTSLVTSKHRLADVMEKYVKPLLQPHDIVFVSEKIVAITQGRAIPVDEIEPGFWAKLLSRYVTKTPGGIGLGMPETMQCAIEECGLARILLAAAVGAAGKLLGRKGWFYLVAGRRAAAIDGPCHWTIPPYNRCVVLAPLQAGQVAKHLSAQLGGNLVLVVDLNDFGGNILGASRRGVNQQKLLQLLKQNPLGQTDECTPVGLLRPIKEQGVFSALAS